MLAVLFVSPTTTKVKCLLFVEVARLSVYLPAAWLLLSPHHYTNKEFIFPVLYLSSIPLTIHDWLFRLLLPFLQEVQKQLGNKDQAFCLSFSATSMKCSYEANIFRSSELFLKLRCLSKTLRGLYLVCSK